MSGTDRSVAGEAWFQDKALRRVFDLLNADGGEVRVVGGAIRNSLMGEPVGDVDMATTLTPDEVMARARTAGIKPVPTGIDHGTVTLVVEGRGFEITTLRKDVDTDGRHAEVAFGTDWQADAERRDFTINALYAAADGRVLDPVGGIADIQSRTIRFIGEAEKRIAEDHLRILRFFRFFGWYGGGRPDAEGLKASVRDRESLGKLSAERVWKEMKALLKAPDPGRALLWMRQTGVLTFLLPETEKWGIDAIPGLIQVENDHGWSPDPLLRLMTMLPPDRVRLEKLAQRLKFSKAESQRICDWAMATPPQPATAGTALDRLMYRHGREAIIDRLKIAMASVKVRAADAQEAAMSEMARLSALLKRAEKWTRPILPISGKDLLDAGMTPGEEVGQRLRLAEDKWVESNFALDRDRLMEIATRTEQKK
ncbi:CCA tRNA nucleotidyltransferase [Pseudohoeflea suaedae]|uniref:CCA tRNA nucleotidyltransferase n=1 Tax=Pseudohoeflea suaedae TaxID=877384 RepID=A0A4V3A6U8_9HYPH|nr:CCA tRNA nucleotidyltransferase [Pseudohoeflea suaedae]TDH34389.1 CCA tRNA nucleotidyltransferase [Pseudohoeflea suaedae]